MKIAPAVVLASIIAHLAPASADRIETHVIGWSADERAFAVRRFVIPEDFTEEEQGELCPGYIDHRGKPFRGTLQLELVRLAESVGSFTIANAASDFSELGVIESAKSEVFVVQEHMPCTPPAEAKKRLLGAKKVLAAAGVSLDAKGKSIDGANSGEVVEFWGEKWRYDDEQTTIGVSGPGDGSGNVVAIGYRLFCISAETKPPECACTATTRQSFSLNGAGSFGHRLASVDLSPSRNTAVVWEDAITSNMRGASANRRMFCALRRP